MNVYKVKFQHKIKENGVTRYVTALDIEKAACAANKAIRIQESHLDVKLYGPITSIKLIGRSLK